MPCPLQAVMSPKEWLKEIAAGTLLQIKFGGQGAQPPNVRFEQILPLVDPDNDPSLATRGNFPDKVSWRAGREAAGQAGLGCRACAVQAPAQSRRAWRAHSCRAASLPCPPPAHASPPLPAPCFLQIFAPFIDATL